MWGLESIKERDNSNVTSENSLRECGEEGGDLVEVEVERKVVMPSFESVSHLEARCIALARLWED